MVFPDDLGKFPASIPSWRCVLMWPGTAMATAPTTRAPSLRRRLRRARMRRNQIVDRGLGAAFAVRDAGERECHFGDRQRPHEHALVHVAGRPVAKFLPGLPAEARPEGEFEVFSGE